MLVMSILLNVAIVITEAVVLHGLVKEEGKATFIYYTNESNLLAMITSGIYVIFALIAQFGGTKQVWVPAGMLRYMATICLTITFLVVVFVLSRDKETGGLKHLLFDDSMKYTHFVCPILSALSFLCFEDTSLFPEQAALICLIPTFLYAIVSVLMNVTKRWNGPYPFLKVYENGWKKSLITAVVLLISFYLIAVALLSMNHMFAS